MPPHWDSDVGNRNAERQSAPGVMYFVPYAVLVQYILHHMRPLCTVLLRTVRVWLAHTRTMLIDPRNPHPPVSSSSLKLDLVRDLGLEDENAHIDDWLLNMDRDSAIADPTSMSDSSMASPQSGVWNLAAQLWRLATSYQHPDTLLRNFSTSHPTTCAADDIIHFALRPLDISCLPLEVHYICRLPLPAVHFASSSLKGRRVPT